MRFSLNSKNFVIRKNSCDIHEFQPFSEKSGNEQLKPKYLLENKNVLFLEDESKPFLICDKLTFVVYSFSESLNPAFEDFFDIDVNYYDRVTVETSDCRGFFQPKTCARIVLGLNCDKKVDELDGLAKYYINEDSHIISCEKEKFSIKVLEEKAPSEFIGESSAKIILEKAKDDEYGKNNGKNVLYADSTLVSLANINESKKMGESEGKFSFQGDDLFYELYPIMKNNSLLKRRNLSKFGIQTGLLVKRDFYVQKGEKRLDFFMEQKCSGSFDDVSRNNSAAVIFLKDAQNKNEDLIPVAACHDESIYVLLNQKVDASDRLFKKIITNEKQFLVVEKENQTAYLYNEVIICKEDLIKKECKFKIENTTFAKTKFFSQFGHNIIYLKFEDTDIIQINGSNFYSNHTILPQYFLEGDAFFKNGECNDDTFLKISITGNCDVNFSKVQSLFSVSKTEKYSAVLSSENVVALCILGQKAILDLKYQQMEKNVWDSLCKVDSPPLEKSHEDRGPILEQSYSRPDGKESPADGRKAAPGQQGVVPGEVEATIDQEEAALDKEKPATDKKEAALDKEKLAADKKEAQSDKEKPAADKKEADYRKEPKSDKKESPKPKIPEEPPTDSSNELDQLQSDDPSSSQALDLITADPKHLMTRKETVDIPNEEKTKEHDSNDNYFLNFTKYEVMLFGVASMMFFLIALVIFCFCFQKGREKEYFY